MYTKLTILPILTASLLILSFPTLQAQKGGKKSKEPTAPTESLETRIARLDSLAATLEASTSDFLEQTADRNDGSNKEKVFAYYAENEAVQENLTFLRNQLENDNGRTENNFYLQAGKVFCWALYREESRIQSPRPRKRIARYYCENGVIFHAIEKTAPVAGNLDNQPFNLVPVAEIQSMTEFMNRKFQHLLDAFRQGWKVTSGN